MVVEAKPALHHGRPDAGRVVLALAAEVPHLGAARVEAGQEARGLAERVAVQAWPGAGVVRAPRGGREVRVARVRLMGGKGGAAACAGG